MNIRAITDRVAYEQYVAHHPYGTLHQTWQWGEFQQAAQQHPFFVLGAYDNHHTEPLASALVLHIPLARGKSYFYAPRGPLFDPTVAASRGGCSAILDHLRAQARGTDAIYLRIDPPFPPAEDLRPFFKTHQFKRAHVHHQPEFTVLVDLTVPEHDILARMKPKGRYNIHLAEKHEVTIEPSDDVSSFYALLSETTARDKFHGHPKRYYEQMLASLGTTAQLFLARYRGSVCAGAIITYFKDTATYYYGASGNEHRNVMAPYLLHWEIMRDAKKRGYHQYDFFGISPPDDPHHPWARVSDFKRKFGGKELQYLGALETVYQPAWYHLMRAVKTVRKLRKRA